MRPPITNESFSLRFVSRKAVHFVRAAFGKKKQSFLQIKWIAFTVSESVVFVRLRGRCRATAKTAQNLASNVCLKTKRIMYSKFEDPHPFEM
jgi:hypothetical protein